MKVIIAYVLVIPLVQFCLRAGLFLVGFPIALLFARASMSLRTKVAGVCSGVAGVALAVAFGYGIFRLVMGPDSFTLGAFLASTLPLLLPVFNDLLQSRQVKAARDHMLETLTESQGEQAAEDLAAETKTAHGSAVVGEIVGLMLAVVWFFTR